MSADSNQQIDPILKLLSNKARYTHEELADILKMSADEVQTRIAELEANGTIRGYQTVIDPDLAGDTKVSAFIEVKLTPERGGGFNRLAMRIARFDQVKSCHLTSGGFDLILLVEGNDLREVAQFVSEKLSTISGVLSCSTHFRLQTYKKNGFLFEVDESDERLSVTP